MAIPEFPMRIPQDAWEHKDDLVDILRRIPRGYMRSIDCGLGWYPIIVEAHKALAALDPEYVVFQVKEKFGTLRYYCGGQWDYDAYREILDEAARKSAVTCEDCGAPGVLRSGTWLQTLCDEHAGGRPGAGGLTMTLDPTAIDIRFDPLQQRMRGYANHGNTPFDVPFVSHITENLWLGGCQNGLVMPANIEHWVTLYPWETYQINHDLQTYLAVRMYDAIGSVPTMVGDVTGWAAERVLEGPTLISCQAGLNRSSLIAALVLCRLGFQPLDAIALIREKRSPACLCNPTFYNYVVDYG